MQQAYSGESKSAQCDLFLNMLYSKFQIMFDHR